MSLLKMAPPAAVRSLDELFAIAHAMEHEAAARYAQLADHVRARGIPELGELFERLAAEEQAHGNAVLLWARHKGGKDPEPAAIRWELPETFDAEAAGELAASRLASAYRILSMAVRNEERAFAFWSYVAAEAGAPEVRQAAEQMAREELEHVSLLRRARRQAYHAERKSRPASYAPHAVDRMAEAGALERHLAHKIDELAGQLTGQDAERARELAAQSRAMADEVARMTPGGTTPGETAPGEIAPAEDEGQTQDLDAQAVAERLVEDYLGTGDMARDETVVAAAQSLAKRAIARLAWLRTLAVERRM